MQMETYYILWRYYKAKIKLKKKSVIYQYSEKALLEQSKLKQHLRVCSKSMRLKVRNILQLTGLMWIGEILFDIFQKFDWRSWRTNLNFKTLESKINFVKKVNDDFCRTTVPEKHVLLPSRMCGGSGNTLFNRTRSARVYRSLGTKSRIRYH